VNDLNLLPKDLRERTAPDPWHVGAVALAVVAALLVGIQSNGVSSEQSELEVQAAELQAEAARYRPFIEEQNSLNTQLQELDQDIKVAQAVAGLYMPWSDYLTYFLNSIPTSQGRLEVSITSQIGISLAGRNDVAQMKKPVKVVFAFNADAVSERAWKDFVEHFENSPEFGIISSSARPGDKTGYWTFDARIGLIDINEVGK
jgi:type IV pilus assembly protein PilN